MNTAAAACIREAIAGGDYTRALELWNEYTAALAGGLLSQATLAEAANLVEWSRPILLTTRAHAAERLRALHVAGAYGARGFHGHALVRARF